MNIPQKLIFVSVCVICLTVLAALGKASTEVCASIGSIAAAFCAANVYLTKTM